MSPSILRFARNIWREYRTAVLRCLSGILALNLLDLLLPLLVAHTYSLLFGFNSLRGQFFSLVPGFSSPKPANWLMLLGFVLLMRLILERNIRLSIGTFSEQVLHDLRRQLFQQHLRLPLSTYERRGTGRYLLRFSGDLGSIQRLLQRGLLQWFGDVFLLLPGLGLIIYLAPAPGLLIALVILLALAVLSWANRKAGQAEERRRDRKSGLLAFTSRRLQAMTSIRAFNKEPVEAKRFERRSGKVLEAGLDYHRWASLSEAAAPFFVYFSILITLLLVFFWENQGLPANGAVFAVVLILLSWRGLLTRLIRVGLVWKKGDIALRKWNALMSQAVESGKGAEFRYESGHLEVQQLGLDLPESKPLSFEASRGELLVLRCSSEGEASQLVRLLAGLAMPSSGFIRYDGQDTQELDTSSLRRHVALVSAQIPLYGDTIGEAICYGRQASYREKAQRLLQKWQLAFPELNGLELETPMSDLGGLVPESRLRLLLAMRALLTKKAFLILEDPFRGLAEETARQLATHLFDRLSRRTVIFITTRPESNLENLLLPSYRFLDIRNAEKKEVEGR